MKTIAESRSFPTSQGCLSGATLQNLVENLPGLFYRCRFDEQWTMIDVSSGIIDLTGFLPQELINNSVIAYADLIYEEDREWIWEKCVESIRSKKNLNNEYRIKTKDGAVKWVKEIANGVYDDGGKLLYIEGYVSDITKIKLEEEVRKNKEFYESIIDNVNVQIAVFDIEKRYRLISKSTIRDDEMRKWMIGRTDYDYCERRNKDVSIADERNKKYKMAQETGRPVEWIEELTDSDGQKRYFLRTLKPFTDRNGVSYTVGYGLDVTSLKRIEAELQKREKLLSFSHSLARIGYWVSYDENLSVEWSNGIYEILELDKDTENASFSLFYKMLHPDDRHLLVETKNQSNRFTGAYSVEYRIVLKNGKMKYINERSPGMMNGDYRFAVLQDITEMKASQAALVKSEKHFKTIAENSPVIIIEADLNADIRYVNRTVGKAPVEAVIGQSVFSFIGQKDHDLVKQKINGVLQTGKVIRMELEVYSLDQQKFWFDVTIGPVKDPSENIESLIIICQEISEKKKQAEERERLIKEINNKYNELMQFNYIVSHNLRSPVANILGTSYLLDIETEESERQQLVGYITQSAEAIDQLIKDLNNVLAARSPLNEKIEKFNLSEIVEGTISQLEKQIREAKALFDIAIDQDADELSSIKSYVQSTVLNLVSNAIKYKSPERQPRIRITASRTAGSVQISVSDNGVGLDLKMHGDQLFGLYKRFHTNIEGKGLGLHMTKMQIESLGGSIQVSSEIGRGTTFIIDLINQ
ncbi:MAG TPA: PAS domain S-box protein [Sphingobacteriaceae bacterium]